MAIVEHLAETLDRFRGSDITTRQSIREWLYWDVDVLSPPVFGCYGVELGRRRLLSISVDPVIADYQLQRAETALGTLDTHLAQGGYLCAPEPTIADLFCFGDVAFAEVCAFDLNRWTNVSGWAERLKSLPDFKAPFDLLAMEDAEVSSEASACVGTVRRADPRAVRGQFQGWLDDSSRDARFTRPACIEARQPAGLSPFASAWSKISHRRAGGIRFEFSGEGTFVDEVIFHLPNGTFVARALSEG